MAIASVGDSRAYVQTDGKLLVITEDQTWVHEVGRRLGEAGRRRVLETFTFERFRERLRQGLVEWLET